MVLLVAVSVFGVKAQAKQPDANNRVGGAISSEASKGEAALLELAKQTIKAHGGDKFRNMKTLIIRGTAEVSATPSQVIPASFAFVYAGEKYRVDINNPFQPLKQIFDGEQTFSSIPGFSLPPLSRLGLPLLQKVEADAAGGGNGFVVSALPEKLKKKKGFRVTSPEGYYTDFFLDDKTDQVKGYEASYDVNGSTVTTSVEVNKYRNIDGVILPESYSQRFNLGNITIYTSFKAKEILVNSDVGDDVFVMNK